MSARKCRCSIRTRAGQDRDRRTNQNLQGELRRENERLRRENERLRKQLEEQAEQITEKEQEIGKQQQEIIKKQQEIDEKKKQITDLERQLAGHNRNSTNSSKPPSSDGLAGAQRQRGRKRKSRRKPGAQPGHPGHYRQLVPVDQVHAVEVLLPQQCGHCGGKLAQQKIKTTGEPRRHQVTEIPTVKAYKTEYQCPNVVCGGCGNSTRATLPEEVRGDFGPQLTALMAYWTVVCRLPRRLVETMLADVLGIQISLGSTQKAWEEVSQAVERTCQELEKQLPDEAVLNVDETGWRTNGDKRWMWALVARRFVFYVVANHRSTKELVSFLGKVFRGILCSDRLPVYLKYHEGRMQLCWAHLKRNLLGLLEDARGPSARRFCRDALAIVARLFRLWYRFRGELRDRRGNPQPIDRQQLILKSIPLQKKLLVLAQTHLDDADRGVSNLAKALFVHSERLYTFLDEEGVEPTNNAAERALRTAVQWRKISFGNRSRNGECATARLLTVTQTCKLQHRHVWDFLTQALVCYRRGTAAPSLLPHRSASLPALTT